MSSGVYQSRTDVPFGPAGTGALMTWRCMGCHTPRSALGSKGAGIFKRCASCVARRVASAVAKRVAA